MVVVQTSDHFSLFCIVTPEWPWNEELKAIATFKHRCRSSEITQG